MRRDKITIVGAGNVGATTAHIAAARGLGDIVLLDIVEGLAEGKALDIAQSSPIQLSSQVVTGTRDWKQTAGSENVGIVQQVGRLVAEHSPESIVIVVCNPLDAMVYTTATVTGFAPNRVMGMAGALDSARFSYFVACELGVSVEEIKCVLMGGHGDDMVPLPRFSSVGGIPVTELLAESKVAELIERTRKGGIEVVNLLGHSAYYAPAAGTVKMAEGILRDKKTVVSCCAYCGDEYNAGGYFVGVPAVLGRNGVEKVIELDLNESERAEFDRSLAHVKQLVAKVEELLR